MTKKTASSVDVAVSVYKNTETSLQQDDIAVEVPVALVFNVTPHAVMMVTPTDLEDFALGFSWTEEIIKDPEQISHIHVELNDYGMSVHIMVDDEPFNALRDRKRNLVANSGCGLCGVETLKQAIRVLEPVEAINVDDGVIQTALKQMQSHQKLQQKTGATHAAAWCDLNGAIVLLREDVGRHNALDKLIGAHIKANLSAHDGFVLVSSRASYEMVQKSALAGFGCLVAVSAPTSLAIEQAQQVGMKLVGFAREGRHVTYHSPGDIQQTKQAS